MPTPIGPSIPPGPPLPPDNSSIPFSFTPQPNASPLILDSATLELLNSGQPAYIALARPGIISIQASFTTAANAQLDARQQQDSEEAANAAYYKLFGIGLVDFIASVSFLITNLDAFVTQNNQLSADQTAQFGTGTPIATDISDLSGTVNGQAKSAVDAMNLATTKFNKGQITQAEYNTAIATYNSAVATINASLQGTLNDYSAHAPAYNATVPTNNTTIDFLNQYQSNFKPPPTPYELQTELPGLLNTSFNLPPVIAGVQITYTHPPIPTLPPIVPLVDKDNLNSTQVQPLADQVLAAAQALLDKNANDISYINGRQVFGLRTQLPVPPAAQHSDSVGAGGSAANSSISAGDPFKEAKNLGANLTLNILQSQFGAGVPTNSPLVDAIGYLHSTVFSRTGLFSPRKALSILGFDVTPPGTTPVNSRAADRQSTIPNAGAQGGLTIRDLSFPVVSNAADITSTQLNAGLATAAALGSISTVAQLNSASSIQDAFLAILNNSPDAAGLTAAQKASLSSALGSSLGLQLSLTSLLALSSALGAPGLLRQFLANVPGLQGINFTPSPLELATHDRSGDVFLEASISDSLQSSLHLSQIQADSIATAALNSAIASGNIATAQGLQDAINSSISAALIANNIAASDAQRASALATANLNDDVKFSQVQNTVIQLDNLKHEVINNLTNQGIVESDAIRIAQQVVDNNKDLVKRQVLASDNASRTIANNNLQDGIAKSLTNIGIPTSAVEGSAAAIASNLAAINPAAVALASPTGGQIPGPEALAGQIKTFITQKLEPLVGHQQAEAVAEEYAATIITSPNSLLNSVSAEVKNYKDHVGRTQDRTLEDTIRSIVAPTKETWLVARLFTDPGQLVTHNASTGLMYQQPVAIKNTPPILG